MSDIADHPTTDAANRLDSWKEIAAYLRHSERTVRRWEEEGLPVHRRVHRKRAAVYAYKSELDAWWKTGQQRLERLEQAQPQRAPGVWRRLAGAAGLAIVLGVAIYAAGRRVWTHARPEAASGRVMMVVLPFADLSQGGQQDYFSDGLTQEMISRLGQLPPQRIGVIARTSAMHYKGTKERMDQIGKELGVDYAVEGAVRQDGSDVRVNAELVRVKDQTRVWGKSYEGSLHDIFVLQEKIAQAIADQVEITLTPQERARLESSTPVNAAAHEAFLKGEFYLTRMGGANINKAADFFTQAAAIDPHYARAYAGLAKSYNAMNTFYLAPTETEPRAEAAARKALALDDNLAEAHVSLGRVELFYDWNWPAAEKEFLRALELNPNLPEAHLAYAEYLGTLNRFAESEQHVKTAYTLDPLSASVRDEGIRLVLVGTRRYQQALDESRKVQELAPDFTEPFGVEAFLDARLGHRQEAQQAAKKEMSRGTSSPVDLTFAAQGLAESGDKSGARALLQRILTMAQNRFVCGYNVATVYAALGEKDEAFHWLNEGIKQRSL